MCRKRKLLFIFVMQVHFPLCFSLSKFILAPEGVILYRAVQDSSENASSNQPPRRSRVVFLDYFFRGILLHLVDRLVALLALDSSFGYSWISLGPCRRTSSMSLYSRCGDQSRSPEFRTLPSQPVPCQLRWPPAKRRPSQRRGF